MKGVGVRRPPPLPPSVAAASANPRTTRLYTQGLQAAVHPQDGMSEGAFGDVSTQTLAFAIDQNVNDIQGPEPSALTIADPELIHLSDELSGVLSRARLFALAPRVGPPIVCSALTAVVCWFAWGRDAPRPVVTMPAAVAAPLAAPAPAEPAPKMPAPVAAAPAVAAPIAPPAVAAPAATPGRSCRARITSRPSGATVMLGDRRLGTTPLDSGEVPCERTSFTLSRPRYSTTTAALPAGAENPAALFVKLSRPPAELLLSSSPANAQFLVNRTDAGKAPLTVPVSRYERVQIEATLPGHRKWQKTLYVTAAATKIDVVLKPER